MSKSTHKLINNKKNHEEYRGIILSIIDGRRGVNISQIKKIVKPEGVLHMSGTTVERIICELIEDKKINFRKMKNEKCYYLTADWVEEEELEQNLKIPFQK